MDRVLELGGHAAGFCGRLFAQSGYDVVRIEADGSVPAWASQTAMDLYLHAGKRRVRTDDASLIAELADRADIVVAEAETADAVASLDLDTWTTPVKVAITPFGLTGPKRNWRATPHVLLAMGGYTNLMGDSDRAPVSLPGHYVEFQSGTFAFTAANACRLAEEHNTIDIGMLEVVMALSQFTTVMWHCGGVVRSRHGSDFWSVVPSNLFRCADGWVYTNIVPSFWDPFTVFLERPELAVDERFENNEKRMLNRAALHGVIDDVLACRSKAEIDQRAIECRIPLGVVQSFEDVLTDPHLSARGVWQDLLHGETTVRSPPPSWHIHGETRPALELSEAEPSAGVREGPAPRMEEPSAGVREGPAPRIGDDPAHG